MAVLEILGCKDFITDRVRSGSTHKQIAEELQQLYPTFSGLSTRSVRRFCCSNVIHRSSQLTEAEVDAVVEEAVSQVIQDKYLHFVHMHRHV